MPGNNFEFFVSGPSTTIGSNIDDTRPSIFRCVKNSGSLGKSRKGFIRNCRKSLSIVQRKRSADCSSFCIPACMNISSMSARIAFCFSLNFTTIPIRMFNRSGPVKRFERKKLSQIGGCVWDIKNFFSLFAFLTGWCGSYQILSSLFAFLTGWCGSYQILSGTSSVISTGLT